VRTTPRIRVDPVEQPLAGLEPRRRTGEKLFASVWLACKRRRARDQSSESGSPVAMARHENCRSFATKEWKEDYGKSTPKGTPGQPKPFRPGDWRLVTNRHQTARAARSVEAFNARHITAGIVLQQDRCPQTSRHPCCRSTMESKIEDLWEPRPMSLKQATPQRREAHREKSRLDRQTPYMTPKAKAL